jgi:hypothetical protein
MLLAVPITYGIIYSGKKRSALLLFIDIWHMRSAAKGAVVKNHRRSCSGRSGAQATRRKSLISMIIPHSSASLFEKVDRLQEMDRSLFTEGNEGFIQPLAFSCPCFFFVSFVFLCGRCLGRVGFSRTKSHQEKANQTILPLSVGRCCRAAKRRRSTSPYQALRSHQIQPNQTTFMLIRASRRSALPKFVAHPTTWHAGLQH